MSTTTNPRFPSILFARRGDRLSKIPTNCFRSSGDELAFDAWTADRSRRVGRTFLIGLWTLGDVTTTSHTAGVDVRSTAHWGTALESMDVLRHFFSTDAIRDDDDIGLVGCSWRELATNLLSGRLNERHGSPWPAAAAVITWHFINLSKAPLHAAAAATVFQVAFGLTVAHKTWQMC